MDEEAVAALKAEEDAKKAAEPETESTEEEKPVDEDEAVVEEEKDGDDFKPDIPPPPPPMKNVTTERWNHLNAQPPLWQRDPKEITDGKLVLFLDGLSSRSHGDVAEYRIFYQTYFKDFKDPLGWTHFSADSGDGVSFKAILYLPGQL